MTLGRKLEVLMENLHGLYSTRDPDICYACIKVISEVVLEHRMAKSSLLDIGLKCLLITKSEWWKCHILSMSTVETVPAFDNIFTVSFMPSKPYLHRVP